MYCSSCGVAVAQNLSYCNHCGAKLNRGESLAASSDLKPQFLISAMVGTFICGLLVITVLMGVLRVILGLPVEGVLAIAIVPFLMMLILEGILLRLLSRTRQGDDEKRALANQHVTNELDEARARLLSQPVASVTEHTTRAFDPIPIERKQK